jgi:hypothetical protein
MSKATFKITPICTVLYHIPALILNDNKFDVMQHAHEVNYKLVFSVSP